MRPALGPVFARLEAPPQAPGSGGRGQGHGKCTKLPDCARSLRWRCSSVPACSRWPRAVVRAPRGRARPSATAVSPTPSPSIVPATEPVSRWDAPGSASRSQAEEVARRYAAALHAESIPSAGLYTSASTWDIHSSDEHAQGAKEIESVYRDAAVFSSWATGARAGRSRSGCRRGPVHDLRQGLDTGALPARGGREEDRPRGDLHQRGRHPAGQDRTAKHRPPGTQRAPQPRSVPQSEMRSRRAIRPR